MVGEPVRGSLPDPSFGSLPGIDRARAWIRGSEPGGPLHHLVGVRLTQVGSGTVVGTMPASPWFVTFDGTIDFRIVAECALAFAVLTGAPAGHEVRPVSITMSYLRQGRIEGEVLVARARTVHSGASFTRAEVLVEDGSGRGVAHGVGTYVIYPLEPAPPPFKGFAAAPVLPSYTPADPYLRPLDPSRSPARFEGMDFLSACRGIIDGSMAPYPIHELLGMRIADVSEGFAAAVLTASERLCYRLRQVSPGVVALAAQHVLAAAAGTFAPAGFRIGVLDSTVTFLNMVEPDGRDLLARGRVSHRRGDLLVCGAEVTDAEGQVVAVGYQTSLVRPPKERAGRGGSPERRIVTLLFSDIVKSTERAAELGDTRWTDLLDQHHSTVRKQLQLFKGKEVKTTGDGFLATFESPGLAVQAARAIRESVRALGLEIRVGIHTGECEVSVDDVGGIAVHIASRILALADPGDVLLSGTVRDLVTGSGLTFVDRGRHPLKGVEGEWQICALDG